MQRLILLSSLLLASSLHADIRTLTLDDCREPLGEWQSVGGVEIASDNPGNLSFSEGEGIIATGESGKTVNLLTKEEFADLEVHAEFFLPEGANSGIYLQGRYEIQVKDSHDFEDLKHGYMGGIYQRWDGNRDPKGWAGVPPRVNAAKPPGQWQRLDIVFRAPRFDGEGNKVEDAVFVEVALNGVVVQRDQPVGGPTRAASFQDEQARGPLMLQGDHRAVAYRNVRFRELDLDHDGQVLGEWRSFDLEKEFDVVLETGFDAEPEEIFEIEDGVIRTLFDWPDGKLAPHGMLVSKRRYSHFDVEFEIRNGERQFPSGLESKPNAGFLYHIQANTPVWPPCLEMQGRREDRGDHFSIRGVHVHQVEADEDLVPLPTHDFTRGKRWKDAEQSDWNRMRAEVRGDRARYYLNGELVNEVREATYGGLPCRSGFIAFQSEFAEFEYRNIRVRPLAAP